jgi:hypothetical protein
MPRSFSTISFVMTLALEGRITATERDATLLALNERGHQFIQPTLELLDMAVRDNRDGREPRIRRAMRLLTSPLVEADEAADIAARLLKRNASRPILIVSMQQLTRWALEAMAPRWGRLLVARLLAAHAETELSLLRPQLEVVKQVCALFR